MLITFSELAVLKGCSPAAVSYAVKHGRISDAVVEKDGKRWLDRDLALELWNKNTRATHNSKVSRPDPVENKPKPEDLRERIDALPEDQIPGLNDSKARREHYLAEKAKLEVQTMQGDLVPAADVKAAAFKKARTVRDSMMAIPDRVIPTLISMTDTRAAHQLLTEEIRTALRSLADG